MPSASTNCLPIVQKLINTLDNEHEALRTLAEALERQLEILRENDLRELEPATQQTSEATAHLEKVSAARKRQMRLVARMLDIGDDPTLEALAEAARTANDAPADAPRQLQSLRTNIHEQASRVETIAEELEYALQYAASVGQEMIAFLRGGRSQPTAQGYTERGQSSTPETPSMLNQLG